MNNPRLDDLRPLVGWSEHDLVQHEARTLRLLDGLVRPGDRVLDVGCGYGRLAQPVADRGGEWTGMDHAERMRSLWLDRSRVGTFFLLDARRKWPEHWSERFDLVLVCGALKQIDPAFIQFVMRARPYCRPGATIAAIERQHVHLYWVE